MAFKKDRVQKVIDLWKGLQKKYELLRKKFLALVPEWNVLQEEAERIASLIEANGDTYTRQVSEELWAGRIPYLKKKLEETTARRDALTFSVCTELVDLKNQIFRILTLFSGAFGNWVSAVCGRLPEDSPLRDKLMAARRECEASRDLEEIISTIVRWLELIEQDPAVDCPVYKWDAITGRALGEEVPQPAPTGVMQHPAAPRTFGGI